MEFTERSLVLSEKIREEGYKPLIDIGRAVRTEQNNIKIFLRNIGGGLAKNIDVIVYNPENDKEEYRDLSSDFILADMEYNNDKMAIYNSYVNPGEERYILARRNSLLFEGYDEKNILFQAPSWFIVAVFYKDKDGKEYEAIRKVGITRDYSSIDRRRHDRFNKLKDDYIMKDETLRKAINDYRQFRIGEGKVSAK